MKPLTSPNPYQGKSAKRLNGDLGGFPAYRFVHVRGRPKPHRAPGNHRPTPHPTMARIPMTSLTTRTQCIMNTGMITLQSSSKINRFDRRCYTAGVHQRYNNSLSFHSLRGSSVARRAVEDPASPPQATSQTDANGLDSDKTVPRQATDANTAFKEEATSSSQEQTRGADDATTSSATTATVMSPVEKAGQQLRLDAWQARPTTARKVLRAANSIRNARTPPKKETKDGESGNAEEEEEEGTESDAKTATAVAAFTIAVSAIALRFGGRAVLLKTAGMDFDADPVLRDTITNTLNQLNDLGAYKTAGFIAACALCKILCLDAISVALALVSGILFDNNPLYGCVATAAGSTLGGAGAFMLSRTVLKDRVKKFVEERKALRAIERAVSGGGEGRGGFQSVLVFRLAPVLPALPIGGYAYLFGTTSVTFPEFAAGTFLGSLKPYYLDSAMGVFTLGALTGRGGDNPNEDIFIIVALGATALVGTFASQVATRMWEEVNAEMDAEEAESASLRDKALASLGENSDVLAEEAKEEDSGPFSGLTRSWKKASTRYGKAQDDLWPVIENERRFLALVLDEASRAADRVGADRDEEDELVTRALEAAVAAPPPTPPALRDSDESALTAYFVEGLAWFWLCNEALWIYSSPKKDWLTE